MTRQLGRAAKNEAGGTLMILLAVIGAIGLWWALSRGLG